MSKVDDYLDQIGQLQREREELNFQLQNLKRQAKRLILRVSVAEDYTAAVRLAVQNPESLNDIVARMIQGYVPVSVRNQYFDSDHGDPDSTPDEINDLTELPLEGNGYVQEVEKVDSAASIEKTWPILSPTPEVPTSVTPPSVPKTEIISS